MENMVIDSFETKNGILVWVRPLLPQDTLHLVDIFEHMGPDSRYRRFHQPLTNVSPERVWAEAENIVHMKDQMGLIAFTDLPDQPDAPIGAARCVCLGDGVAETAVSVRDDMQNQGIATYLMLKLAEEAKRQGVKKLIAAVQNGNRPILRVLKRMPYPYISQTSGAETELVIDLTKSK